MEYNLEGLERTADFGRSLAKNLKKGDVISLIGDLGAGKTTLTKSIAAFFGVDKEVTSPTFSLVNTYETDPVLNHMDLYRLEEEDEILSLDIDELLYPEGITIIEWAEMAKTYMPRNLIEIYIDKTSQDSRRVRIEPDNKRQREIIEGLNEDFSD
ncbi:MAG: tRNA (adenosine(37)-N6)-threonylcarbamoyltransferase complex ATPase subunit type 1 TsaE [Finegoldia sp.]|nr:tRNA (adenosine(37)-N6)-threonylcarbamoyltransferase complex ATPase subunit type 1 TsaE [Finegoldia sp.]